MKPLPLVKNTMFTMPVTFKQRQIAEQFQVQHSQPDRKLQIYRNTLAILAVHYYCQCLEIPADLENSESWNPVMQSLGDIADLLLPGIGKLECRPVESNSTIVKIPAEVWGDRIGYLAVQFNQTLSQAKIVGFLETVNAEKISLSQWQPLDDFVNHIDRLQQTSLSNRVTCLNRWLQGVFETGWESIEAIEILLQPQFKLGFNFRYDAIDEPQIRRAKLLKLEHTHQQFALFVGLTPVSNNTINVVVELYLVGGEAVLPQDLQLMVLDHTEKPLMQSEANRSEKLQFKFSGELGEAFSLKLVVGEVSITEAFVL
jgi:hypothetical protein